MLTCTERELAHDQDLRPDVDGGEVHPPPIVVEGPQAGDPVGERRGGRLVVVRTHPEQDRPAHPDGAQDFAIHEDPCPAHPLAHRTHRYSMDAPAPAAVRSGTLPD